MSKPRQQDGDLPRCCIINPSQFLPCNVGEQQEVGRVLCARLKMLSLTVSVVKFQFSVVFLLSGNFFFFF